jgi:phosphinothricin acetyltransferase
MAEWFRTKAAGNYPVIGAIDEEDGSLLGFSSYGTFRSAPAYKYTVEHSVYVRHDCRGRGLGRILLQEIIDRAQAQNYHVLVGGIDSKNEISIRLHEKFGFAHCGGVKHAGFKFGQWLDLVFYQLILPTPAHPVDG